MIDIKTFMLALALGNIGFAMLIAGYARGAANNPAMQVWKWAKLVLGCAQLLGWMRNDLPGPYIELVSNVLLVSGVALELAAYCTLFGVRRWRRMLMPAAVLALLAYQTARLGGMSGNDLTVLMSLLIAAFTAARAVVVLRAGARESALLGIICFNDLVFALAMCLRAYTGITHGSLTVFSPGAVQSFTFVAGYVVMIVNGFGFLLLCKERDDRKLELLATIDSLTGLVNRRAFFERTASARMLAARLRKPIALMMLDIDHFKRLNDRFGHATGDEALCLFAATAQEALRDHDIMGRLGGEEFALVLPGTDLDGALQAAERLRLSVAGAVLAVGGKDYTMTVSVGVVLVDPDEHIKAAMARADHALYMAKSAGRNRVVCGEDTRQAA
ncbi:MAG: GGDEF domain-containing protein [Pseudomonadota bacterium]